MIASGILLLLLGIVSLLQIAFVRRRPGSGRQLAAEEQAEHIQALHARAGQRAYGISGGLAFLLLMWASFGVTIGLPPLAGDTLWFSLAALVILPSIIYIASIVYEQSHY